MDSFELNKIAGAVLATLLVYLGIQTLGDTIFDNQTPNPQAYIVEGVAQETLNVSASGVETIENAPVIVPDVVAMIATASIEKGARVAKKCVSCHSFEKGGANRIGPALYNVVNRNIGSVAGFNYSKKLNTLDGTWDYAALNSFLLSPKKYAAGTKMAFAGLRKPSDRAAIIAYLRSMADTPAPLTK